MFWLARSMIAVRPTPNVAFCPKLRKERLVVVFREAFSNLFSTSSYCSASYCSLLNNYMYIYIYIITCVDIINITSDSIRSQYTMRLKVNTVWKKLQATDKFRSHDL